MKNLVIASAFTILSTAAFAQEAPYMVWDGQVVYAGQSVEGASTTMIDSRSMTDTVAGNVFTGGNINWDVNYNGR